MTKTLKTATANYDFNTNLITVDNKHHLGFVSNHVMFNMGLSAHEFYAWTILRNQYKAAFATNEDVIKCYHCDNTWLMSKIGIKDKKKMRAILETLTTKGLLFSVARNGGASYRAPLDPADNDYSITHSTILKFIENSNTVTTNVVIKGQKAQPVVKVVEAPVSLVEEPKEEPKEEAKESIKVEEETSPKAPEWDYNTFIAYVKTRYGLVATPDVQKKEFTIPTGNLNIRNFLSNGLANYGWKLAA
ncbi:hypothetical protein [Vibrio parahaemolyticus]|uniref:hypothetical protein n=1 Tax=Vibrio parahaemolyticus TaxID=670 RepID=UPI0005F0D67A|nr:hypothetical protein [Vibrio parahaemolyticus]KJR15257.1 hypothetical protein UF28_16475 [Vibrio parahaemolyticus]